MTPHHERLAKHSVQNHNCPGQSNVSAISHLWALGHLTQLSIYNRMPMTYSFPLDVTTKGQCVPVPSSGSTSEFSKHWDSPSHIFTGIHAITMWAQRSCAHR